MLWQNLNNQESTTRKGQPGKERTVRKGLPDKEG
jgi:hypothetical protein